VDRFFCREIYSEDETQSARKFPSYHEWRDGFLRPTLATAYRYLRRNRYLLWNIADVRVGSNRYPLERDSVAIMKELGAEYVGLERMALANLQGSGRIDQDGRPTSKNCCKIAGKWRKFEPIFVFRKP